MAAEDGELHRKVAEPAPVPIAVYDDDFVLRYANPAAVDFVEASDRSALVGTPATAFVPADREDRIASRMRSVIEERSAVPPTETRLLTVDGQPKYAMTASAPVRYEGRPSGQVFINDITPQKRTERQLRAQRDRFQLLFDRLPNPAIHARRIDGEPTVVRVNDRFADRFLDADADPEGSPLEALLLGPDNRERARAILEEAARTDRYSGEIVRETDEGTRTFKLDAVRHTPEGGEPEGYAIYTDITAQKATERQLQRERDRLDEFAAVVGHDLRNPLNVARGTLADVQADLDPDASERLQRSHDRIEAIVEDLLVLARQGETVQDPEALDLASVVRDAWASVETPRAELAVPETTTIEADRDRLRQLLENLFRNAVEHGSQTADSAPGDASGGSVTVTVDPLSDGFAVSDDGPGIPPAERERVFESGYTTQSTGTGLGLAIVERVADGHDWSVTITESEAGGARFAFRGTTP